jgi:hypothetical protein
MYQAQHIRNIRGILAQGALEHLRLKRNSRVYKSLTVNIRYCRLSISEVDSIEAVDCLVSVTTNRMLSEFKFKKLKRNRNNRNQELFFSVPWLIHSKQTKTTKTS